MKNKINNLSTHTAILIMVVCVLLGVALGNRNALHQAVAKAEKGFSEVEELTGKRIEQASNLLVLANRSIPEHESTKALSGAVERAKSAKGAKAIVAADQEIADAAQNVLDAMQPVTNDSDQKLAVGVADELISVERRIERTKKAYNEGFQEAIKVYQKLPTRWLLQNPQEVLL